MLDHRQPSMSPFHRPTGKLAVNGRANRSDDEFLACEVESGQWQYFLKHKEGMTREGQLLVVEVGMYTLGLVCRTSSTKVSSLLVVTN